MKRIRKSQILGGAALAGFGVATVVMMTMMARTVGEIKGEVVAHTPDAILASAGLEENESVSLPVVYYDQKADDCEGLGGEGAMDVEGRQFEWSRCGYFGKSIEQGMVEYDLGEDKTPVAVGGKLAPNRSVLGTGFEKWFSRVEGENEMYNGVIKLMYSAKGAEFTFYREEFYPIDALEKGGDEKVNRDGHNHLFTMSFALPLTVLADGNESFEITADDDTWVYIDDKLAIDMGGVHKATTGMLRINEEGEVYAGVNGQELAYTGVMVAKGEGTVLRIFHADRDADNSVLGLRAVGMNLSVMETQFARSTDNESVQIAYDPSDPSYVAPLGVTSVVKPDATKGFVVIATVEGVLVVLMTFFTMGLVKYMLGLVRNKK